MQHNSSFELDDAVQADGRPLSVWVRFALVVLAGFGGWVLITACTHAWATKADVASVVEVQRQVGEIKGQLDRIEDKVDSTNLRVTQLKCGHQVENGCR